MIYYTASNGTIIGGTTANEQSSLQGITHLPSGADYAIFVDDSKVNGLNPNNVPGTYSFTNVVAGPTLNVPTATGIIQFTEQPLADQLSSAQATRQTYLTNSFNQAIGSGFPSSADATARTYAIDPIAMGKWTGTLANIDSGMLTTNIMVKDINGNKVTLTPTQFKQMAMDGFTYFNNQEQHLWTLEDNVNAATTVSAVNAIVW